MVTFELLSPEEAKRRPAGFGREDPNENPHLDTPPRPPAPWDVIGKAGLLWAAHKKKLYAGIACVIITLILILVIYFAI